MHDYIVRRGTRRAKTPARDLYAIPTRCVHDDGRVILAVGAESMHCADCKVGRLCWAEAGYVPWHRICDTCGSHWDLHPIMWGPARPRDPSPRLIGTGVDHAGHPIIDPAWCEQCGDEPAEVYREVPAPSIVRFVDGQGEVPVDPTEPLEESGCTWGDLMALLTEHDWIEAAQPSRIKQMAGTVCISAAWARRARFYE